MRGLQPALAGIALALSMCGCAVSRKDQLVKASERVERTLLAERDRVNALPTLDGERSARLSHLSGLRYSLSGANIALASVPMFLDGDREMLAYDVLDEVYGTIDWNIPLGPSDPKRALPSLFVNNQLNIQGMPNYSPSLSPLAPAGPESASSPLLRSPTITGQP